MFCHSVQMQTTESKRLFAMGFYSKKANLHSRVLEILKSDVASPDQLLEYKQMESFTCKQKVYNINADTTNKHWCLLSVKLIQSSV